MKRSFSVSRAAADFHDGYTPIRPRHDAHSGTEATRPVAIVITEPDERELRAIVRWHMRHADARSVACLEAELTHAAIVDPNEVPPDVVTMNSWVVYEDERTGVHSRVKLVFPSDAGGLGRVSVLAPLGTALLGVKSGQTVLWSGLDRKIRRLSVKSVPYQPERSGQIVRSR